MSSTWSFAVVWWSTARERPGVRGDVAMVGDRIVAVGEVDGQGREEIDADGLVVAPGFVDAHTHMDAQVFWDDIGNADVLARRHHVS